MRESDSSTHARPYISSLSAIWVKRGKGGRSGNAASGSEMAWIQLRRGKENQRTSQKFNIEK